MAAFTPAELAAQGTLAQTNPNTYHPASNPKGLAGEGYKINVAQVANDTAAFVPAALRFANEAKDAADTAISVAVNSPTANSDSAVTIAASGNKAFHTTTDLQTTSPFRPGMWITAVSTANAGNAVWGFIPIGGLDYAADAMTMTVIGSRGSGTFSSWYIIANGPPGAAAGLGSVLEDTSPQQGGDLDSNGFDFLVGNGSKIDCASGSGGIDLNGAPLVEPVVNGGYEKTVSLGTVSNTVTINPASSEANQFDLTLGGNVAIALPTTLTTATKRGFQVWAKQDGTGGRTIAWPSSVKWAGGAPTQTPTSNATDIYNLIAKKNGSTVVYAGSVLGQGFVGL